MLAAPAVLLLFTAAIPGVILLGSGFSVFPLSGRLQLPLDEADDEVLLTELPAGALSLPVQMVLDAVEQLLRDLEG